MTQKKFTAKMHYCLATDGLSPRCWRSGKVVFTVSSEPKLVYINDQCTENILDFILPSIIILMGKEALMISLRGLVFLPLSDSCLFVFSPTLRACRRQNQKTRWFSFSFILERKGVFECLPKTGIDNKSTCVFLLLRFSLERDFFFL